MYKFEAHTLSTKRILKHWERCSECGLILLRNSITEWCFKMGCEYEEHPNYRQKLRE